jgi:N-acetylneuraminic acid mutarotase
MNSTSLSSSELYDPTSGEWTTTGSLNAARRYHTATLLEDGRVLVTGGEGGVNTSELYNQSTKQWGFTASLYNPRAFHSATLLNDGKILVVGGHWVNSSGYYNWSSTELFDPTLEQWTYRGSLNVGRYHHTATLLDNGKVLATGGWNATALSSSELYDPTTSQWAFTGATNFVRYYHSATLFLNNGKVLVIGGSGSGEGYTSSELYDPATSKWTIAAVF